MDLKFQINENKKQDILKVKEITEDNRSIEEICLEILNKGLQSYTCMYYNQDKAIAPKAAIFTDDGKNTTRIYVLDSCSRFGMPYYKCFDRDNKKFITVPQIKVRLAD